MRNCPDPAAIAGLGRALRDLIEDCMKRGHLISFRQNRRQEISVEIAA
jgi:hypothetical protein